MKRPSLIKFQDKPEAKILHAPTGAIQSNLVSIKKTLSAQQEINQVSPNEPQLAEPFTFDQIKMVWRQFAHQAKAKAQETMYNAMIKRDPILIDEHQLILEVDNQIQIDYITQHMADILAFIRTEVKNFKIQLELKLSDAQHQDDIRLLTGKDRFQSMAKKNPNLHSFKNMFNLDIEY